MTTEEKLAEAKSNINKIKNYFYQEGDTETYNINSDYPTDFYIYGKSNNTTFVINDTNHTGIQPNSHIGITVNGDSYTVDTYFISRSITTISEGAFTDSKFSSTVFTYAGTTEEWEAITKDGAFNTGTVIKCFDGDITI